MILSFADEATEDLFYGSNSRAARKSLPRHLWTVTGRKLEQLDSALSLVELLTIPGNRLEALTGDRKGQYSIRINKRYRICFRWSVAGPTLVEVVDYH